MFYAYKAKNASGRIVKGFVEAEHRSLAVEKIMREYPILLDIKEDANRTAEGNKKDIGPSFIGKPKVRELTLFTRQLGTMIASGLPIVRSLDILAAQSTNGVLKKTASEVKIDLESGKTLYESMSKHNSVFSGMYLGMIRAGETGGMLDSVMTKLSDHLEREWTINSKVKSASTYPVVILVIALLLVLFILIYVMPTFVAAFEDAGAELPGFTLFFLGVSDFIKNFWWLIIICIVTVVMALKTWGRRPSGRLFFDTIYLRMPLVGPTVNRIAISRFTRTMAALTSSGVPIIQSMDLLQQVIGNRVMSDALGVAQQSIKEGETIAEPLARTEVFEPMVTHMIAVGEETGQLDQMLQRMSDFYDKEVIFAIESLTSMLEPIMLLVVAFVVCVILGATYLPMFNLIATVQ